ncbi:alpha/beta fold hydrolase [Roseobacter sp. S98]|uniref:alpha/beta fold hydrolase n=1 Tax=Roseobacter algicola (ex Choi et al. 2025) (nom. illeg.) TaxID=3092138 RepID=UPI0035C6D797
MTEQGHLLFDADAVAAAGKVAVLVPGAHAAVSIFDPAEAWTREGYALVRYRFPGLDGRPVHPALDIAEAAREIADFAIRYPGKELRLLGYSTGGAIVLDAAALIVGDLRVALMSSAVERGGGLQTGLRGAVDVAGAALRARSVDVRRVWLEYYRTLLFGRADRENPAATRYIDDRLDEIVMPDEGKPRAHTDDLRRWTLPDPTGFDAAANSHLFVGLEDPVFSLAQTQALAQKLGGVAITGYPGHGHLLFLTEPRVFDDVLDFFEDRPFRSGAGHAVGAGNSD